MILFLDIDGVLRTHKSDLEWSDQLKSPLYKRKFSTRAVSNLNIITGYTRAKIVVISTWRTFISFQELKNIFKVNVLIVEPKNFIFKMRLVTIKIIYFIFQLTIRHVRA